MWMEKNTFLGGKKEFIILNSYLKSLFKHMWAENNIKLDFFSQSVHKINESYLNFHVSDL